ncbi:UV excision repair protein RAD23 B [Mortierella alpina]|nr:UV excision repair protein RAD23 B [Mortierella alpina]
MLITVKTLKQETFKVDVDETDKVLSIKEKIEQLQGHPVSSQKLIFSGKILEDDKPVSQYNISEKDFLVIMVTKAKPAAASSSKPAAATTTPTPTSAPAPTAATPTAPVAQALSTEQAPAAAAPANAPVVGENPAPAASTEPAALSSDDNALLTGSRLETAIQNMMEMGFPRDQCLLAMRASFNNPDRAVEYLMTGIPEHLQAQASAPAPAAAPARTAAPASTATPTSAPAATAAASQAPAAATTTAQPQNLFTAAAQAAATARRGGAGAPGAEAGAAETDSLAFLRDQPQFQQIREMVQHNPDLLQPLLIQLGQSNPQMLQLINQNQQAFLQLLNEGNDGEDDGRIYVTQEEQDAIQRLENLGFDHRTVVEAFFACDRNEEMAANYLFDHGHEDMEEDMQ